ncbi:MAG TPA: sugar phosphate isomerase/epimerase family protein [Chloroflexota bacterium]|nr:sugar phosphate isomerase/epimerase family protein [Chloroflexota bacterium]
MAASGGPLWAVSTSLVASPQPDEIRTFFDLAREAGAHGVELARNTPDDTVREAERLVDADHMVVTSLHHPVPASRDPSGARVEWLISDPDPDRWERAVHAAQTTLRQASRYGCRAVVMHSGEVTAALPLSHTLIRLLRSGDASADQVTTTREELLAVRAAHAPSHLEQVKRALERIVPVAEDVGIRLGLESRDYYAQIPTLFEIRELLAAFPSPWLGYWHDVGHAMCQQAQGFARHADFLEASRGRLVGLHLHDIIGTTDHRAPGTGEMDYASLVPYVPPHAVRTLELNRACTWPDVHHGISLIRSAGLA